MEVLTKLVLEHLWNVIIGLKRVLRMKNLRCRLIEGLVLELAAFPLRNVSLRDVIRADNELVWDLDDSRLFTEILRCVQASQPARSVLSTLTVDNSTVFSHPCIESIERRVFDQNTFVTQVSGLFLELFHRLSLLL